MLTDLWIALLSGLARARVLVRDWIGSRLGQALLLLVSLFSFHSSWAADEPVITLHFNPRVPYEYLDDGQVTGIVAQPIERAFRKAGVAFRWAETPVARQFFMVKSNTGQDCLAGRFKNTDRESWAQFSKPVYRDQPQLLLARSDNERMKVFTSMAETLQAKDLRVLVKLAYSYGPVVDGWLSQRERPALVTADENFDMLRQINLNMADVFIIAEEEAEGLIKASGLPAKNFQLLKFRDAPPGELRYIMCSKSVPASVMDRLDAAITFKNR